MIRVEISKDGRCQVEVNGEAEHVAFEFATLVSKLAINMPKKILEKAFEDGLFINEHGMKAFEEKMDKDIEDFEEMLRSEESDAKDSEEDDESDRDDFKKFTAMMALAAMMGTILGDRNDKTGKH